MLQFLQPIWLFALAALGIPIIIHLWNQRPGKILRVGSIALVAENAVSRSKSIRLTEVLLLILRCLLLTTIVMALAVPSWKSKVNHQAKGWVLMDRQQAKAAYTHFQPLVDSLLQTGMEFHYFEEGFKKDDIQKALQSVADTTLSQRSSYRATIALLNEQADPQTPIYVFTDNYLAHFDGYRSAASLNLHWFTFTADTSSIQPTADTMALHITLFAANHTNDAGYVRAAVDAIKQFSNRNIILTWASAVTDVPVKQDWLFWLAEEPIPPGIQASYTLQYAKAKIVSLSSFILPATTAAFESIPLYTIVIDSAARQNADVIWKDGFGHPLLDVEQRRSTTNYLLYTHIDPAWNELPWSEDFPQLLYGLLYSKPGVKPSLTAAVGKTMIDSSQLLPVILNKQYAPSAAALFSVKKIDSLFWLIAFILFFAERSLSFYHRKTVANA